MTKVAFESPAISKMEHSPSVAEAIFKFSHIPFAFFTFWHLIRTAAPQFSFAMKRTFSPLAVICVPVLEHKRSIPMIKTLLKFAQISTPVTEHMVPDPVLFAYTCVCMYVCICICIYYIHTYVCITYIHTFLALHKMPCVCVCSCVYVCVCFA
jgi:hypothetical protein